MLGKEYTREDLMTLAPQARSVPQVFDGDKLIGGLPELRTYIENR